MRIHQCGKYPRGGTRLASLCATLACSQCVVAGTHRRYPSLRRGTRRNPDFSREESTRWRSTSTKVAYSRASRHFHPRPRPKSILLPDPCHAFRRLSPVLFRSVPFLAYHCSYCFASAGIFRTNGKNSFAEDGIRNSTPEKNHCARLPRSGRNFFQLPSRSVIPVSAAKRKLRPPARLA